MFTFSWKKYAWTQSTDECKKKLWEQFQENYAYTVNFLPEIVHNPARIP